MKHVPRLSQLAVDEFTSAKLVAHRSLSIPASSSSIWSVLTDPERWYQWLPAVKSVESWELADADDHGVGGSRLAVYGSGDTIREAIVYAEKNRVLAYQVDFPSMVKDHLSVITLDGSGPHGCEVSVHSYFTPTEFSGYMMKFGVYSMILKGALQKLRTLCISDGRRIG